MTTILVITLIRTADNEVKLAWKVLIIIQCKTYFLAHKYINLCHNRTIRNSSSYKQVKHIRNKIVTPEWLTEQRVVVLHCACTGIAHMQYEEILNPRTSRVRLSSNLVNKLQKQFLDGYAYRTSVKRGEGLYESPKESSVQCPGLEALRNCSSTCFILEDRWCCIMLFVNCKYLTCTDIVLVGKIMSKLEI